MLGAHTSEPERRTHSELDEQQSESAVQREPSAAHALVQASADGCGRHLPLQHAPETAQLVPSPLQATTCSQRSTFALAGSAVHLSDCDVQH